jgi:uncharacterized protein (TIGR03435 family)
MRHSGTALLPVVFASALLAVAHMANAQAQVAPPAGLPVYDITSVKPHDPADTSSMGRVLPDSYEARNSSLKGVIAATYGVRTWLVFGLPPWAESARYDIRAKVGVPDPKVMEALSPEQRRAMLELVLRERFGLHLHIEMKEQPVYELTVMPEGPKFHASAPLAIPAPGEPAPQRNPRWRMTDDSLKATEISMKSLLSSLSYEVQRQIVDKTGLSGAFDLELHWTPDDRADKAAENGSAVPAAPPLQTALREQLGLKLTPAKGLVPTVVVDSIRKPEPD